MQKILGLAAALSLSAASTASAAAPTGLPTRHVLTVPLAMEAAKAALAACQANGYAIAVAVVDAKGQITLVAVDPEASPISIELSQRKARAAALFKSRSGELGERFRADPVYAQNTVSIDPRLSGARGAFPILLGQELVGAMGASGAPGGDKDEACVQVGLAAIGDRLRP